MTVKLIDGKQVASNLRDRVKGEVSNIISSGARPPCLAVVLVGEDPASKVYVKTKSRLAHKCGISVVDRKLDQGVSQEILEHELRVLSDNDEVDGILLQLPLPKHLDEFRAICAIGPQKDVDGLHPHNQGLLAMGKDSIIPCTPSGCMDLIEEGRQILGLSKDLSGLSAVVVGRSILVGKPAGLLLLNKNATVTYCHSKTKNLKEIISSADIAVIAAGKPKIFKLSDFKEGSVVVDVGINRLSSGQIVGDVEIDCDLNAAITPVPGGVGPMTIATLLSNCLELYKQK